jgi:hypothetical protein
MSAKEMGSRRGKEIEIIDAIEEATVGATRSNKIYHDFDMKGKPIVVEDLTACDGRDDTFDYLGSKGSGYQTGLSPKIGGTLGSHDRSVKTSDDDEDDEPPREVNIVKIEENLDLHRSVDTSYKTEDLSAKREQGVKQWATRFPGEKVDITGDSVAVDIAPSSEVNIDKIKVDFGFHNSADTPLKTEELLAKRGEDQKPQVAMQTGKKDFSTNDSAVVHIDGIPHRRAIDDTSASARALYRKAVLEKSLLRRMRNAVAQDVTPVDSSTAEYNPIPRKSREEVEAHDRTKGSLSSPTQTNDGRYFGTTSSGRTGSHPISSWDTRSQKAVRAKPGRKLDPEEAKRVNDLTARSDIIHIPTMDDEVCTDLKRNSSDTADRMEAAEEIPCSEIDLVRSSSTRTNRMEAPGQAPIRDIDLVKSSSNRTNRVEVRDQASSRDIDLVKSSSSRTNRAEILDQASSRDINLVKSSSNRTNRAEVVDQAPSRDIEIKTNTQKCVDDKDLDRETENAILCEPDKKIEHGGTHNYAFHADESEHIRETSMQEEEKEIRSIDIIHVDSHDVEDSSMRAIGIGEHFNANDSDDSSLNIVQNVSEDSSDRAVKSEAAPVKRHAKIEESDWDAPEAKENGQGMPALEKSNKDTPLVENHNQGVPEVEEYNQDTPEVVDGTSVGNNTFELMGNDQDRPVEEENKLGIIRVERAEQENTESDDEPEIVQLMERKKASIEIDHPQSVSEGMAHGASKLATTIILKKTVQSSVQGMSSVVGNTTDIDKEIEEAHAEEGGKNEIERAQKANGELVQMASELATSDASKKPVGWGFHDFRNGDDNDIDSGMEHNAIQLVYPKEDDIEETVQDAIEIPTAITRKKPARLFFDHDSTNVVENETHIDGGMEHYAKHFVYPEEEDLDSVTARNEEEDLDSVTAQGNEDEDLDSVTAQNNGDEDLDSVTAQGDFENSTNDDGGADRDVIQVVYAKEERHVAMGQDDSELMTANTRKRAVRVDYQDFTNVVGNSTNADVGMEHVSQLVGVVVDDEEDDTDITGPNTANAYNHDLAMSDETSSESSALNDGREDDFGSPVFETPTPKAANKATKEVTGADQGYVYNPEDVTGVDHGSFYNSEDDNTGESGSKVSMEESKGSLVDSLESDLEIDIDLEEDDDVYESFALPFVVQMLDRSCAWFEQRPMLCAYSYREPSLLDKTKKWTSPAKKSGISTTASRKSSIPNKNSNTPNMKRTPSRNKQGAKHFDTTAIKPQHSQEPETISKTESAINKTLASDLQPTDQDSTTDNSSKNDRPRKRSSKTPKKKTSKRKSSKAQYDNDDPDSTHFQEKLRQLWIMKRQAQKYKEKQALNEHSEDSEQQWYKENSAASDTESFSQRSSMTAPIETSRPTRKPNESYVRRPVVHPTNALVESSLPAKTIVATEAPAMPAVSPESPKASAESPVYGPVKSPVEKPRARGDPDGKTALLKRAGLARSPAKVRPESFVVSPTVKESPSEPAQFKRAQPSPEASNSQSPEYEPPVRRSTRGILLAGGPESMVKPSRLIRHPRSIKRNEHSSAVSVLEKEEHNDRLQIAAAEEAIAEAISVGYDALSETERLAAIELAEKLKRRASALKRRRKQRERKLLDLRDMQDTDYNFTKEDAPSSN